MAIDYLQLIEKCEFWIRAGEDSEVATVLDDLKNELVPREFRLPLANFAYRTGKISAGLRLLAPVVRPERGVLINPSPAEMAEYAILLQRNGSLTEAYKLLSFIETDALPEVRLYQAMCCFNEWEYARAIPFLRKYLESDLSPYQNLVGRVNLAAALVITEQNDSAAELLASNIATANQHTWSRLEGNCLELRAQVNISQMKFSQAREDLEKAQGIFAKVQSLDQLFVLKWQAILGALELGDFQKMAEFKRIARERRDWEGVREAALFELKAQLIHAKIDTDKLLHLYFGTPFQGYRARIEKLLGPFAKPDFYCLGTQGANVYDLQTAKLTLANFKSGTTSSHEVLRDFDKPSAKTHRLLGVLLQDLYRPCGMGGLFAGLFPAEHFDIFSSPNRVHQIIARARQWLLRSEFSISILEDSGVYSLDIGTKACLRIPRVRMPSDAHRVIFHQIANEFAKGSEFSASEARARLSLSESVFKSFARWAIENGHLVKFGKGAATLYAVSALENARSA